MASSTASNVVSRVLDQLNDPNGIFFTVTNLNNYIYDGMKILCLEADAIQKEATFLTTVTGTRAYSIPTGIIDVWQITYSAQKVQRISAREYMVQTNRYGDANSVTGTPQAYTIFGTPGGNGLIKFDPIPDSASACVMWGTWLPSTMPGSYVSGYALEVPEEYVTAVEHYVLWKSWNKGASEFEQRQAAMNKQAWLDELARAKRLVEQRAISDRFYAIHDLDNFFSSTYGAF